MDIMLIIVLIAIAAVIIFGVNNTINKQLKEKDNAIKRLSERISQYDEYLLNECDYAAPFRKIGIHLASPIDEIEAMEYYSGCEEYEKENQYAPVKANVKMGEALYDLQNSKYNRLAIQNYKNENKICDLQMHVHFYEWMLKELANKNEVDLEKVWEKISRKAKISKVMPSYHCLLNQPIHGEVTNVDEMVAYEKERGRTLTNDRIKWLKKRSERARIV